MARFIFTNIASPAAMLAITFGTVLFLLNRNDEFWLLVKLTLVTTLVVGHGLIGYLLLKIEKNPEKPVLLWCVILGSSFLLLMTATIYIVLAKPVLGLFQ